MVDENSRYKDVVIYGIVEVRSYMKVKQTGGRGYHNTWRFNGLAEQDGRPHQLGWNIYGAGGRIDYSFLDIEKFPTLGSVQQFIDFKLKEIKYHG